MLSELEYSYENLKILQRQFLKYLLGLAPEEANMTDNR